MTSETTPRREYKLSNGFFGVSRQNACYSWQYSDIQDEITEIGTNSMRTSSEDPREVIRPKFNRTIMRTFQGALPRSEDSLDVPIRYAATSLDYSRHGNDPSYSRQARRVR